MMRERTRVFRGGPGALTLCLLLGIGGIGAPEASAAGSFAACQVSASLGAIPIKDATYATGIHLGKGFDDSSSGAFEFYCPVKDDPYCTVSIKGVHVGGGPDIQVRPRVIIHDVTTGLTVQPCAYADAAAGTVLVADAPPVGTPFAPGELATPGFSCTNSSAPHEIWIVPGSYVQVHTTCQFSKAP